VGVAVVVWRVARFKARPMSYPKRQMEAVNSTMAVKPRQVKSVAAVMRVGDEPKATCESSKPPENRPVASAAN